MIEEKGEVKVLAISNTQTVIVDKNKVKESDATNAEKVKFYIIYFF